MHTAYKVSMACVKLLSSSAARPLKVLLCSCGLCLLFLAIKSPHLANSILFQSSGLTNGVIDEKDIPEELPKQKKQKQEQGESYEDVNTDQGIIDEEGDVSMSCMSCLS